MSVLPTAFAMSTTCATAPARWRDWHRTAATIAVCWNTKFHAVGVSGAALMRVSNAEGALVL